MHGRTDGHCSRRYKSYWDAFLLVFGSSFKWLRLNCFHYNNLCGIQTTSLFRLASSHVSCIPIKSRLEKILLFLLFTLLYPFVLCYLCPFLCSLFPLPGFCAPEYTHLVPNLMLQYDLSPSMTQYAPLLPYAYHILPLCPILCLLCPFYTSFISYRMPTLPIRCHDAASPIV